MFLLIAIILALRWDPRGEESPPPPEASPAPATAAVPAGTERTEDAEQAALSRDLEDTLARQRAHRARRAAEKSNIETHLEILDTLGEEEDGDEYASRLYALGNLYQQKNLDFATAAGYYELLIDRQPEWPGIRGAYHQLISCYVQTDNQTALRLLYRKMIEVFPEDSEEALYAEAALNR